MRIDVLTLFPEVLEPYLSASIMGRAVSAGLVAARCVNFRDFTPDRHSSVDGRPFGGGPGMVLKCGPMFDALENVESERADDPVRILLTPQGERFTQALAGELAKADWLVILCGHYEGFDERIRTGINVREVSIGDYVLSGGEPAAMVLMDAVVRLLPRALGDSQSSADESFMGGTLEYPQYTRPRDFRGMKVPEVLLSGDHAAIREWRMEQSMLRTASRRPDLLRGTDEGSRLLRRGDASAGRCRFASRASAGASKSFGVS